MTFKRRSTVLITLLVSFMLIIAGWGSNTDQTQTQPQPQPDAKAEKTKVAFVYVGPVGDAGWSFTHDAGRKYLMEKMPDVETSIVESVPECADAERVITQLAEKGNKIIF